MTATDSAPNPGRSELDDTGASLLAASSATARLDRIPIATRSHRRWMLLLGFLFTFDLVDLNTFAYVAPALRTEWGISIDEVGAITSIGFAGMFVGAVVGGRLSDRFGRRPLLLGAVCFFSFFSLLSAFTRTPVELGITRFLTGIGLQAMTGVLLVWVSEMYPRALRGRYQALILAIGFVGIPIAALVARVVVPSGDGHWRWVFVVGSLGLIGAVVAARALPESIRWQVAHGREEEASATIARFEDDARRELNSDLPEPVVSVVSAPARLTDLLSGRNLRRLVSTSLVSILLILCFYGFNSWIPTLLVEHGYTVAGALNFTLVLAVAAVPGALLAVPFIDRWDRRWLLLVIETMAAVMLLLFGLVNSTAVILAAGFFAMLLLECGVAVLYTYIPEVFPTSVRGLGSGIAGGFGRLAGVIGGVTVGWVFTGFGFTAVFVYLAVAALLMGVVLVVLGERTTDIALDSVGETASLR